MIGLRQDKSLAPMENKEDNVKRKTATLAALFCVIGLLCGTALEASPAKTPAPIQPVTLKIWSAFETHAWTANPFLHWFIDRVNKKGKGVNLSIELVGGPEVFPTFEGIEALRRGLVDAAYTATSYHVGVVPESDAMKLSRLTPWEERVSGAYALMNEFHQKRANVYFLYRIGLDDYFHLYLNVSRETPDLSGLKIRSTPIYDSLVKALGGTTITIAPPEVYTALERGVVNGYGWPAVGIRDRKWEEVTKYIFGPAFYGSPTGVFLNLDTWNRLHENQRALLASVASEMERESHEAWADMVKKEYEALGKLGIKRIQFSPQDTEMFIRKAYESAWEEVIRKAPDAAKLKPLMSK